MDFKTCRINLTTETQEFREIIKVKWREPITEDSFEIKSSTENVPKEEKKSSFDTLLNTYLPKISSAVSENMRINVNFDSDFLLACFVHENFLKKMFIPNQKLLLFHVGIGARTFCNTLVLLHRSVRDFNFFGCDKRKGDKGIFLNGPNNSIDVFGDLTMKTLEKEFINNSILRLFSFYIFDVRHQKPSETVRGLQIMFLVLAKKANALIRLPNMTEIGSIQKKQYNYIFYLLNCIFDTVEMFVCPWTKKFYLICLNFLKFSETQMSYFEKLYVQLSKQLDALPWLAEESTCPDFSEQIEKVAKEEFTVTEELEVTFLDLFDV